MLSRLLVKCMLYVPPSAVQAAGAGLSLLHVCRDLMAWRTAQQECHVAQQWTWS